MKDAAERKSPYNAELQARVNARHAQERLAARLGNAPPTSRSSLPVRRSAMAEDVGGEPVRAIHRGFAADALRRVAHGRGEDPAVLAIAIVERALRDGTAEELLGEDRAEDIASGFGKRPVAGISLTRLQCAVIYLVGGHGGMSGWCAWSGDALARLLPPQVEASGKYVTQIISMLAARGLIERRPQVGNMPRHCRLTELGRAVYGELAGDADG